MQNEWLTIKDIVDQGLLDELFFRKKAKDSSKYEMIRQLVKSGKLRSKQFGEGKKHQWSKIHIDWITEYKNSFNSECCNGAMIGGTQCEVCGSNGKLEK